MGCFERLARRRTLVLGFGRRLEVGVRVSYMDLESVGSEVLMVGGEMASGSSICERRAVGYKVNDTVCRKACSCLSFAHAVEVQVIGRMVLVVSRMGTAVDLGSVAVIGIEV